MEVVVRGVKVVQRIYLVKKMQKSEQESENSYKEILVIEEFFQLHITPFHEYGSLEITHKKMSVIVKVLINVRHEGNLV